MLSRFLANTAEVDRTVVGVAVSADIRRIAAICVHVRGIGLAARIETVGNAQQGLPMEAAGQFRAIAEGRGMRPGILASLAAELAELQARLARDAYNDACENTKNAIPKPILIGTQEPGLWHWIKGKPHAQIGLCDAARLAELTGLNVIDDFPARDLAQGGAGGPIEPLAQWMLLHHGKRNRVLLDLGRTTRITYLPAGCEPTAAEQVAATDVGPGMALLDALTQRLTGGQQRFDPGGSLAVQGRCIPKLLAHLRTAPYFERPLPRWHPDGAPLDWFLAETLRWGETHSQGLRDLLCTVTHLIAVAVCQCLDHCVPSLPNPVQLILAGGGERNGLLLRELHRRLDPIDTITLAELDMHRDLLDAACVAILALLHVDHVPQTLTHTTGLDIPRVLGRLTPGSPRNWQRLLQAMAESAPTTMSLRCAM